MQAIADALRRAGGYTGRCLVIDAAFGRGSHSSTPTTGDGDVYNRPASLMGGTGGYGVPGSVLDRNVSYVLVGPRTWRGRWLPEFRGELDAPLYRGEPG